MDKVTTARMTPIVRPILDALKTDLHAAGMKVGSKDDIACALVWAARALPIEVIKGAMEAYAKAEARAASPRDDRCLRLLPGVRRVTAAVTPSRHRRDYFGSSSNLSSSVFPSFSVTVRLAGFLKFVPS